MDTLGDQDGVEALGVVRIVFIHLFQTSESLSHLGRGRCAGGAYLLDGDRSHQVAQQSRLAGLRSTT